MPTNPVDYGFEVNFYHSEEDRKNRKVEMVDYKFKEDQNPDLKFIEEGEEALETFLNSDKTIG